MTYRVESLLPSYYPLRRLLRWLTVLTLLITMPLALFLVFWVLIEPAVQMLSLTAICYVIQTIITIGSLRYWQRLSIGLFGCAVVINLVIAIGLLVFYNS